MVTKMAIVAITRHGIEIARRIKQRMPEVEIYVPAKSIMMVGMTLSGFQSQALLS